MEARFDGQSRFTSSQALPALHDTLLHTMTFPRAIHTLVLPTLSMSAMFTPVMAQSSSGTTPAELLLTNIPGLPEAEVPGLPGVFFDPGSEST
ncbi:MAG: hypothetical protein AAGG01_04525, partial [Planctomycetota bacterium]